MYPSTFTLAPERTVRTLVVDAYPHSFVRECATDEELGAALVEGIEELGGSRYVTVRNNTVPAVVLDAGLWYTDNVGFVLDCAAACKTNKINAIKLVRELTLLGLKEAKEAVESYAFILFEGSTLYSRQLVAFVAHNRLGVTLYSVPNEHILTARQRAGRTFDLGVVCGRIV